MSKSWTEIFLAELPAALRAELTRLPDLASTVERMVRAGEEAWPTLAPDPEAFVHFLAQKLACAEVISEALLRLHTSDLYLAWACQGGQPRALTAFNEQILPGIQRSLARLELGAAEIDEVTQLLCSRLFVAQEAAAPLIAKYSGHGRLQAWVRVTAVRLALALLRQGKKEIPVEDQVLQTMPLPAEDPELGYLKELYRDKFKNAFRQAMGALTPRELNVIQLYYIDGLTTYQIGSLFKVNQTTAARWLTAARQSILAQTRTSLMQLLQVDRSECDSIIRLMDSHLDLTLRSLLIDT